jgi:hypothetical protein
LEVELVAGSFLAPPEPLLEESEDDVLLSDDVLSVEELDEVDERFEVPRLSVL